MTTQLKLIYAHHKWLLLFAVLSSILLTQPVIMAQGDKPIVIINQVDDQSFPEVHLRITALDPSGLALENLNDTNFQVWETEQAAGNISVAPVAKKDAAPISLVLAIDISGSMDGKDENGITKLESAKTAAKSLITNLSSQDQAALLSFSEVINVEQPFTTDSTALNNAIDELESEFNKNTALYQALFDSAKLTKALPLGKKAIVLLTDGENTHDNISLEVALELAKESGTPVYTIGFFTKGITASELDKAEADLKRISAMTDGRYFPAPTTISLVAAFQEIDLLLRLQYDLKFTSNLIADCQPHKLEVNVSYQGQDGQDNDIFSACPPNPAQVNLVGPIDNQTINKINQFAVTINAPYQISNAQFQVSDISGQDTSSPFEFVWDATDEIPGNYTLIATVTDSTGKLHSIERYLTVQAPLTVNIIQPVDGQQLSGQVEIIAQVSGPGQLKTVELFWNGDSLIESNQKQIQYVVDLKNILNGDYIISAEAIEVDGYTTETKHQIKVVRASTGLDFGLMLIVGLIIGAITFVMVMVIISSRKNTTTAQLIVLRGRMVGHGYPLFIPETTIGRSQQNQIIIEDPTASRQHAIVKVFEQRYIYYDMSPDNPSIINGQELSGSHELQPGDQIQIGDIIFQFRQ
jgi:VWFA-related protein